MQHSTISRTSVNITDPDENRINNANSTAIEEQPIKVAQSQVQQSAAVTSPHQVEVKLLKIKSDTGPQSAERLPPKGKCCSLQ